MISVTWTDALGRLTVREFTTAFRVGRDPKCDVVVSKRTVSREHIEVFPTAGGWTVRDLGSGNGTFLDGRRVHETQLPAKARLRLGAYGPELELDHEMGEGPRAANAFDPSAEDRDRWDDDHFRPSPSSDSMSNDARNRHPLPDSGWGEDRHDGRTAEEILERYTSDGDDEDDAGERTQAVRRLYRERKRKQRRPWIYLVSVLSVVLAGAVGYAVWQEFGTGQRYVDLFYDIKTMELELAKLEAQAIKEAREELQADVRARRIRIQEMRARYQRGLEQARLIDPNLNDVDRLILRVASIFGESELTMPPEFADKVKEYIQQWQTTDRLRFISAMRRLQKENLLPVIRSALGQYGLAPQFMYVALQESNFNHRAVGPSTRFGIAKGAWQFIPATAQRYGMAIGPLAEERAYDHQDERFDFYTQTHAAARYLSDIYSTDAQASGLLVMASYNWGPNNIIKKIRTMPENPRERNFWALLQKHRIPDETYGYVFSIIAAAVIGENPRLFGFDFDNPLEN